ncbi:MAG: PAAR domain-containing protein [Sphingomonadaceae bacterium]
MQRAVICKGDPTSHGGTVLEGNELFTIDGRPVAQLGHMTFCPLCKGKFPIIEGLDFHTYAGIGTSVDGMHAACGAQLKATQTRMTIDDAAGSAASAPSAASAASPQAKDCGVSFRAIDERSGQAVSGLGYRIVLPGGGTLRGKTDSDGYTERVTGQDPATVELYWDAEPGDDDDA